MELTEENIKLYSYTEGTRAIFIPDLNIQNFVDIPPTIKKLNDFLSFKVCLKYNTELNMFYAIRWYGNKPKENPNINMLGFKIYKLPKLQDLIIPLNKSFVPLAINKKMYLNSKIDIFTYIFKRILLYKNRYFKA